MRKRPQATNGAVRRTRHRNELVSPPEPQMPHQSHQHLKQEPLARQDDQQQSRHGPLQNRVNHISLTVLPAAVQLSCTRKTESQETAGAKRASDSRLRCVWTIVRGRIIIKSSASSRVQGGGRPVFTKRWRQDQACPSRARHLAGSSRSPCGTGSLVHVRDRAWREKHHPTEVAQRLGRPEGSDADPTWRVIPVCGWD